MPPKILQKFILIDTRCIIKHKNCKKIALLIVHVVLFLPRDGSIKHSPIFC